MGAQAQQLVQVEAAKVQEELANTTVEGFSSDETVRCRKTPSSVAVITCPLYGPSHTDSPHIWRDACIVAD